MNVSVNGEPRELPAELSVAGLLSHLGLDGPAGIAIAVNARVVARTTFESHALRDGDEVEIIRAAAGG